MITRINITAIKNTFKPGARILVHSINDPYVFLDNDIQGTIQRIDDLGTIHVTLDNGMMLGLISGLDSFQPL